MNILQVPDSEVSIKHSDVTKPMKLTSWVKEPSLNDLKHDLQQAKTSQAQAIAKAMHKPSLNNKESMAAYAKAMGIQGKASFMPEQMEVIDYV